MEGTMTLDQVRLLFHEHLVNSIAPFLGILFSGGLLTLGIKCIILLSSKGQGTTRQKSIGQIYVVLVVIIVLGYQVEALIDLNLEAFQSFYEKNNYLIYVFTIVDSVIPLVIITLTDGLLVWRCYMVQKALGPNSRKLQALFWIIPLSLWCIVVVAGSTVIGLYSVWRDCKTLPWCKNSAGIAESIAIIGNVMLNLSATGYIVTRLLIHRRKLIYLYGQQFSTSQHNCTISILLESSIINAPIAIMAVVQLYTPVLEADFLPLIMACQAFMSILIVYQVALHRASRHQDDQKEVDEERATIRTRDSREHGTFHRRE